MKSTVLLAILLAFAAAAEEKKSATGVDVGDQALEEVMKTAEAGYYGYYNYNYPYGGYYNPYGYQYNSYYRPGYGSGYGHWRGRRSVQDQTADDSYSRGWGYNTGSYHSGYSDYYRPSYYYGQQTYGHYPYFNSYHHL